MTTPTYTTEDVDALRCEWERTFGEPMSWGFEINEPQIPMLRRCIRQRSKKPLERYIASLPRERVY